MHISPRTLEAVELFRKGSLALAEASHNGIRVDMEYCTKKHKHIGRQVTLLQERLNETELLKQWRKMFGKKMMWQSDEQLATVLYDGLGYEPPHKTKKGKRSTDTAALEALKIPEVNDLIRMNRLLKARDTFLAGIIKETVKHGKDLYMLHPFFYLNRVISFRSSSADPNFQNFPKRVPEMMRIIRRAFIPREGFRLAGVDFSGAEVRCGYCYHKDPSMREEILNPERDMHRDCAIDNFKLTPEELGPKGSPSYKELRHHGGKNGFVFPQFYGDYYVKCAKGMWMAIDTHELKTAQGVPLRTHLSNKGIHNLEDFTEHIKDIEYKFWYERFPVYNNWRKSWYKKYGEKGYFDLKTGFRCVGYMRRNQVCNYPVQGAAFHWILWSMIRLMEIAKEEKWKTKIIGQIHDECNMDVHPDEAEHVMATAQRVMTKELTQKYKWITIPIEADAEMSEINGNWSEMK